jgi:hypothetical protein
MVVYERLHLTIQNENELLSVMARFVIVIGRV